MTDAQPVRPSTRQSVVRPIHPSSRQPPQSVYHPARQSLSIHRTDSPSVIPAHPSYEPSIHPPVTLSMTRQSATPPVSPVQRPSDHPSLSDRLYTILPRHSDCPTSSDHTSMTEFRQPLQVQSHLEMPRILVQLGHIQRT